MGSRNPFDDDDNGYDNGPYYNPAHRSGGQNEAIGFYEKQIDSTLQSTLDSTARSLRMLEESEQIGIATAEELIVQGEKLKKVDSNLDDIDAKTKETQRHLTGIKSIFGGMRNYFSKPPPTKPAVTADADSSVKSSQSTNRLSGTVSKLKEENPVGFRDDGGVPSSKSSGSLSSGALKGTKWEVMDDEVDSNLDLMGSHLRRIRELGIGLGDQIDEQNKLIDRIATKTDKSDVVIRNQDKQMQQILGVGKGKKGAPAEKDKQAADEKAPMAAKGGKFK